MALTYGIQNFNPTPPIDVMGIGNAFLGARNLRMQQEQAQMVQAQADAVARAKAEAEAADRAMIAQAFDMAHKDPTPENQMKVVGIITQRDPAAAKALTEAFNSYNAETQQTILRDSANILTAFYTNPEFGIAKLEEAAMASEAAGDAGDAKKYLEMVARAKSGPNGVNAVKDYFTFIIGSIPGGDKAFQGMETVGKEMRAREAAPAELKKTLAEAGLSEAKINETLANTAKLEAETRKLLVDLEAKKAQGLYDPQDAAAAEDALRKEFDGKQKVFNQVKNYYDIITNAETTGIGDVALIFTYMKILDPGSVVREGEFATAANAGGVPSSVIAAYNKALGTGKIDDKVRNEIKSQSKKIFDTSQEKAKKDAEFYTKIATRRGLNLENILESNTGASSAQVSPTANVQGAPAGVGTATPGTSTAPAQRKVTGDL